VLFSFLAALGLGKVVEGTEKSENAIVNMDRSTPPDPLAPGKKVSERFFSRSGLEVHEQVMRWDSEKPYKVIWCLVPFDKMVAQGRKNPLVHFDIAGLAYEELSNAREIVQREFDKYHGI
jgi:hypothetical protein